MDERDLYQGLPTQDGGYFHGGPRPAAQLPAPFTGGRIPNPKFGSWGDRFEEGRQDELAKKKTAVTWRRRDGSFPGMKASGGPELGLFAEETKKQSPLKRKLGEVPTWKGLRIKTGWK